MSGRSFTLRFERRRWDGPRAKHHSDGLRRVDSSSQRPLLRGSGRSSKDLVGVVNLFADGRLGVIRGRSCLRNVLLGLACFDLVVVVVVVVVV